MRPDPSEERTHDGAPPTSNGRSREPIFANASQPYSLPLRRPVSALERALLEHIVLHAAPQRISELVGLHVVGRCGCGKCPTVIFGRHPDAEPLPARPFVELATYAGKNADGVLVAVTLIERDGELSELEAWSPDGGDIEAWPAPSALAPF